MATTYMKLPYEDRVLRPGALRPLRLSSGVVGFTLDVRLNYYRGLPLSAVEDLELHPAREPRYAGPEGAELFAPVFGRSDVDALESDLTIGGCR